MMVSATICVWQPAAAVPAGYLRPHEWGQAQLVMGDLSIGLTPNLRQLLRNLLECGGGQLSLRIGGSTPDRTREPRANSVTPFARLYQGHGAPIPRVSFILGVTHKHEDVALATLQARAYVDRMPSGSRPSRWEPDAFLGNKYRPPGARL
jgi:hypothetical protein